MGYLQIAIYFLLSLDLNLRCGYKGPRSVCPSPPSPSIWPTPPEGDSPSPPHPQPSMQACPLSQHMVPDQGLNPLHWMGKP